MKKIIAALAAVSLASAIAGGFAATSFAAETPTTASGQTILSDGEWTIGQGETPVYGKKYSVPVATVKINGQDVVADSYVVKPDGSNTSGDITLSMAGKYTVVYSAKSGGKLYKTEKTFEVNAPFISGGEKSSYEFGTYTNYGSSSNNTGYLLKIAEREEITFNKLIDFNALTKGDELIRLFILPQVQGAADFDRLILTFTDSADSSITLTVVLDRVVQSKWPGSDSLSYVKAAGNGQELTGIENYGSSNEKIDVNNEWGACVPVSFTAMNDQNGATIVPSDMRFTMSFDKEENILKARGIVVTDFDDAKYYKTLWKGFPSGKAKLSVSASGLNSETANVVVTGVFGLDFSETTVEDETAPIITVDTDYDMLPAGKVGIPYSIPSATALDDYSGVCDVETKVAYAYGTNEVVTVKISDGKIIPEYIGEYTVIYSAKDGYGNLAEKKFTFNVKKELAEITINIPEYCEYTLGDTLSVLTPTTSGGSGKIKITTKVTLDGEEVALDNGKVKLDAEGEWKVYYRATDYLNNTAEEEIELVVESPEGPVFAATPELPEILVDGSGYVIPEYYAEDYSSGKCEYKLCNVTIVDALGKKVMASGDRYVARANRHGDLVTFVFECNGAQSEEFKVPVIMPKTVKGGKNVLDVTKYFYGTGFEVTTTSTDAKITATQSGDIGWTFGNALLAEIFSIDIHTNPEKTYFEGLRIALTDAKDAANTIEAMLDYVKGKTYLTVNGESVEISGGFNPYTAATITLSYSGGIFAVGNTEIEVTKRADGGEFGGFKSEKAYLSVEMLGASVGAEYDVRAINLHKFNSNSADYTDPSIYIDGKYGGSFNLGGTYVIPAAFAGDVLAPETTITLNVYDPDGKIVRDVKGKKLENVDPSKDYEIELSKYGQYRVLYNASEVEWWNRSKLFQYMVSVYDGEAPEITFAQTPAMTAKVGDTYVLPKYTVTDNVSAAEDIAVACYVVNTQGKLVKLKDNAFKFSVSGKYVFRIIAIDEQGNTAIKDITVIVSDKE